MATPQDPYPSLLHAATIFCEAFRDLTPPSELLNTHFTRNQDSIFILEHGTPPPPSTTTSSSIPFLNTPFHGASGLESYFSHISSLLHFSNMRFVEYIVDTEHRKVVVRGKAWFTWKVNGQSWYETFVYILRFDDEDRVERYEVWADSGAVGLAARGELES